MARLPPIFVTGTDTGVGKTYVSTALLRAARLGGLRVCGYKPVASGCEPDADGVLRNEDALRLLQAGAGDLPYEAINPYAFAEPLAPHVSATRAGKSIELAVLDRGADALIAGHDWVLIEGAGGWRVPLNAQADFADWVSARGWPVLLVVGMRLGCISHALLTADAILRRGLPLLGWVANELPPAMDAVDESVEALVSRLPAPLLGRMRAGTDAVAEAAQIFERIRRADGPG